MVALRRDRDFGPFCRVYAEKVQASLGVSVICALAISSWAQTPTARLPRFEDYPAKKIYSGIPAAPKINTPIQRRYRTRIGEGVEKGWGVLRDGREQNHPGPNFAGTMIVVQWGCGSPCLMMAMIDAVTGKVYEPPLGVTHSLTLPLLNVGWSVPGNPEITFRQDSRLMVIKATPDYVQENHHSYAHYYVWQGTRWSLLHRERLD